MWKAHLVLRAERRSGTMRARVARWRRRVAGVNRWPVWLGLGWLVCSPYPAGAAGLRAGARLQTALAADDNAIEATVDSNRVADEYLRLVGEARVRGEQLLFGSHAQLRLRGFSDSYADHPELDRRQGEATLSWGRSSEVTLRRLELDAGYGARAYPDSSDRGHRRYWGRLTGALPAGAHGLLVGRVDGWRLDFGGTPGVDRSSTAFDLSYERRLASRYVLDTGLELGALKCGWLSQRLALRDEGPDSPVVPVVGDSHRRDQTRFFHVGLRRAGRLVLQLQLGYRSHASNSFDGSFRRPEVAWLVSRPLGWRIIGQFYGTLEHTHYTDAKVDRVMAVFPGKINAGDDDNTVALRLARRIGRGWDVEARAAWYRNESLDLGVYYRKQVVSVGISRNVGQVSDF